MTNPNGTNIQEASKKTYHFNPRYVKHDPKDQDVETVATNEPILFQKGNLLHFMFMLGKNPSLTKTENINHDVIVKWLDHFKMQLCFQNLYK